MSLFLPETWPFSIDLLPDAACLVGGSVRDRLLNRQASYLDLDFVLPEHTIKTASKIARAYKAGFVVLDAEREIARVVFDQVTVDFAQQQGESIEADLHRRDFTINAIAYHPKTQTLIDPLNGEADIQVKVIRMVSPQNLTDDPLRLMRGYRQAAQLGFTLSPETQLAIDQLAPQLAGVSVERIHSELDALLSVQSSGQQLYKAVLNPMVNSQLLQFCLPHFTADSVEEIASIDRAIAQLRQQMPAYAERLQDWIKPVPAGVYQSWIKAAKLSQIFCADVAIAREQLKALKYSRSEAQVVLMLIEAQPHIEAMRCDVLTRSQQFFLFKAVGQSFPAFSLLAVAQGVDIATLRPMIDRFLDPENPIAHSRALITGTVIMKQLGVRPGPEVGALLKAVEQAQAAGTIDSKEGAIAWAKSYIEAVR